MRKIIARRSVAYLRQNILRYIIVMGSLVSFAAARPSRVLEKLRLSCRGTLSRALRDLINVVEATALARNETYRSLNARFAKLSAGVKSLRIAEANLLRPSSSLARTLSAGSNPRACRVQVVVTSSARRAATRSSSALEPIRSPTSETRLRPIAFFGSPWKKD